MTLTDLPPVGSIAGARGAAAVRLWGIPGAWVLAGAAAVAAGVVIAGLPGPGAVPVLKGELA